MEKKNKVCKICDRRFASGKAMGGHMRSHFAKLPIPPKPSLPSSSPTPPPDNNKSPPPTSALSRDASSEPHRSELSSDAESPKNPTRRRSKRPRKLVPLHRSKRPRKLVPLHSLGSPPDLVSSIVVSPSHVTLSSEDAAMSLLMLSKDKWPTPKEVIKAIDYESDEEVDGDVNGEENVNRGEDENNDYDDLFCVAHRAPKVQKYKCETCNKAFKSHQALGGHRASHKNKRASMEEEEGCEEEGRAGADDGQIHQPRIFACPFCDKVFQSGQALGGHKKVHFTYLAIADKVSEIPQTSDVQLFDLNLPVAEEGDESYNG